jgi:hypothetical protein
LNPLPYTQENLHPKVGNNERTTTFNDMHLEIEKLEENKSFDKELIKQKVSLLEGSRKIEASSIKNYYF